MATPEVNANYRKYDARKERTLEAIGNELSRHDFTYNIFHHPKGLFLQRVMKPAIMKMISWVHNQIKGKYDKNSFVFDDLRLKLLHDHAVKYCNENMEQRKVTVIIKLIEICLFILKEDKFYRARFFDALNKLSGGEWFMLNPIEKENLEAWKGK